MVGIFISLSLPLFFLFIYLFIFIVFVLSVVDFPSTLIPPEGSTWTFSDLRCLRGS